MAHQGCFNPRARAGRDGIANDQLASANRCFNPRARAGRDLGVCHNRMQSRGRFNPRARAGRDQIAHRLSRGQRVSIHAPARGATRLPMLPRNRSVSFNPRARAGRDFRCYV